MLAVFSLLFRSKVKVGIVLTVNSYRYVLRLYSPFSIQTEGYMWMNTIFFIKYLTYLYYLLTTSIEKSFDLWAFTKLSTEIVKAFQKGLLTYICMYVLYTLYIALKRYTYFWIDSWLQIEYKNMYHGRSVYSLVLLVAATPLMRKM